MMRFPALLTAKLAKARIARVFRPALVRPFLHFADPAEVLHPGSAHPVSHEKVRGIIASRAPVIWIGGGEPLDHPGIAHFVRALATGGHYIFLETGGALLRRRIHEFQPLPRLFLIVRVDSLRTPGFDLAVEGLRAARLSGFFTAAHSRVHQHLETAALIRVRDFLSQSQLDGWLITAQSPGEPTAAKAAEARSLIPSVLWRQFSEQVEREFPARVKSREAHSVSRAEKPLAETCEEGVRVA